MFIIEYAKNPKYNNEENTSVVLDVKFKEFNIELPFTANQHDTEAHGIELYNRAIAGEFGTIVPFNG